MRMKLLNFFIVAMLAMFSVTVLSLVLVRSHGQEVFWPAYIDILASMAESIDQGLDLKDGLEVRQRVTTVVDIEVTHIGVGVANFGDASDDAVVIVRLIDSFDTTVAESEVLVSALRNDDVTLLPVKVKLSSLQEYEVVINTRGVSGGNGLTVSYEPEQSDEWGRAVITKGGLLVKELDGNIRIQLLRRHNYRSLITRIIKSWFGVGVGLIVFLLGLVIVYKRRVIVNILCREELVVNGWTLKRNWRELIFVLAVGLVMSLAVTMPYFTQLDRITTMGDVQRALVYRGVARDALLDKGEIALWEPYLCGGEPLLANMESAQLDPFFLLVLVFGENLGVRMSVVLTLIIGFLGVYALARRYGELSRSVALMAAALFSFSGFQMLAFANGNFAWVPVGWIPWVLYFYLGSFVRWVLIIPAAFVLAFIFLGGSLHMVVYALLAAGFLGLWLVFLRQDLRPLVMLGLIIILFVPLVAIKLLPVAEVQSFSGDFIRPIPFIQPWSWIYDMFVSRDQLSISQWKFEETGENFRWIEYGAYVGIMPVILFFVGILAVRRRMQLAMVGAASLLLLVTFGWFPWAVLRELPFLDGVLRNPQRVRVVFLLFFGLLAGYGLEFIGSKLTRRVFVRRLLLASVVTVVLIDLATFHSHMYGDLFNLERPYIEPVAAFERVTNSYTDNREGVYKVSYENYRAGQGTADMCMPYMMERGAYGRGRDTLDLTKSYFGEAKLTQDGEVHSVDVDGDEVIVSFNASEAGWLVLNQNFFPGWRSIPAREVISHDGLVAVRVQAGDDSMIFRYAPRSYELGFWISVVSVMFLLFWLFNIYRGGKVLQRML